MELKEIKKLPPKEIKEVASIRLYPSDKALLIEVYGSIQNALDALVKAQKG